MTTHPPENPMAAQYVPSQPARAGHDHAGHSHAGHAHDHAGHDHSGHSHDHAGHDHSGHSHDHAGHSHVPSAPAAPTPAVAVAPGGAPEPTTVADVEEALRDVIDPELGINVVDLGLLYGITIDQNNAAVLDMTLTSAACPLTDVIEDQAAQALDGLITSFRINWVWMPPWGPEKITPSGREQLRALGFNV